MRESEGECERKRKRVWDSLCICVECMLQLNKGKIERVRESVRERGRESGCDASLSHAA